MAIERVAGGEELTAFLDGLGAPGERWVAGVGMLMELVIAGADGNERRLEGDTQLLSLCGPVRGPLMVIVASERGVTGGRLVSARSAGVSLFVSEVGASAEVPAALPDAEPPDSGSADDDESDEAPRYGDRVDHFVFGLCDVMVVREERMKIRDASGGGRLREIHLRAVKVLKPTVQDGRRVFKLARRS